VLQDLQVTAGDSRLSGELALLPQALLDGRLVLQSEDVAALAPLLLTRASGAMTAEIALSSEDGAQAAAITAEIDNLRHRGCR
jgi:translocation and assembly module TamB